jgi:uncharacterized protein (TIGR00369 family)
MTALTPAQWLDFGRETLDHQACSRLLGAQLRALTAGRAQLELPLRTDLLQQHGFAHGGVISYPADNALTYADGTPMPGAHLAVTSEFKVNYVSPAVGERLIARAEALAAGRTQAVCRCAVFAVKDGEERLCAVERGTIVSMSDKA